MVRRQVTFTFAAGASVSDIQWLGAWALSNLVFPAGFSGDAVGIQAAAVAESATATADSTWEDCTDAAGNLLTIAYASGKRPCLLPAGIIGLGWVRLKSYTSGSAQTQSAERVVRGFYVTDHAS